MPRLLILCDHEREARPTCLGRPLFLRFGDCGTKGLGGNYKLKLIEHSTALTVYVGRPGTRGTRWVIGKARDSSTYNDGPQREVTLR
jgi:hypothetical protein